MYRNFEADIVDTLLEEMNGFDEAIASYTPRNEESDCSPASDYIGSSSTA